MEARLIYSFTLMKSIILLVMAATSVWSADLVLPTGPLERTGPLPVVYRTNQLATVGANWRFAGRMSTDASSKLAKFWWS